MKKILIYAQIKSYFFVCSILLMMSLIKKPSDRSNPREEQQKKTRPVRSSFQLQRPIWVFPYTTCTRKIGKILLSRYSFLVAASWTSQTLLQKIFFTLVVKVFRKLSLLIFLNTEFRIGFKITSKNDFSTKYGLVQLHITIILWILFTWFIRWRENYYTVL